jgi:hypothetical protein
MHLPASDRELDGGLRLRSIGGPEDIERVAAFDALIHGADYESAWRSMMAQHPGFPAECWLFIEERASGRIVASLCLLPWRLQYCGVELLAAEMGVVGTLEEYRGRGLQRALNTRFAELLEAGSFDLSHIQGIPYFYRQFGYEYAMPLEAWWRLEMHMLPEALPSSGHSCRQATPDDIAALLRLYDEAASPLDVSAVRDEATWAYLLGPALQTELAAETWLVQDSAGQPAGYFRIARQGFGDGLILAEASALTVEAVQAALWQLRRLTIERQKPYLRLNLPAHAPLAAAARALGAYDGSAYAWQVRLPNPAALLRKLAPVFQRRLAGSDSAGLTRDVVLNLYRQRIVLRFERGRLTAVEEAREGAPATLWMPPALLAPLLLGYRSLDEMRPMYPDAGADRAAQPLVETLFPKLRAWLYQQY